LLANHAITTSQTFVAIFLVELPSLLFLTCFSIHIVLWCVILHSARQFMTVNRNYVKILFLALNLVLYLIFITLVLLFVELPADNKFYCGKRFLTNNQWPPRKIVNVIYRVIISAISLLLAGLFFVTGTKIYKTLTRGGSSLDKNTAGRKLNDNKRLKFLWLAAFTGTGLLFQSVYLLILISIQPTQSNTATILILLIVEVIPSFVVLLFVHQLGPFGITAFSTTTPTRFSSQRQSLVVPSNASRRSMYSRDQ